MLTLYYNRAVFAQLQYIVRCMDHFYLMWDDSRVACQFHICYGSWVWNVRQINMDKQRCMAHPSDLLDKTNHVQSGDCAPSFSVVRQCSSCMHRSRWPYTFDRNCRDMSLLSRVPTTSSGIIHLLFFVHFYVHCKVLNVNRY